MDSYINILFTGFGAAVIAAILFGTRELLDKYLTTTKKLPLLIVLIGQFIFAAVFILFFSFIGNQFTANGLTILFAFLGSIVLCAGMFLQLKAITIEDFSLTLPFLSFTFIFLIPVEYLFFHQLPTQLALMGLATIIAGTFWLGFIESKEKSISWRLTKGSRLMILVALFYSLAGNIDKAGTLTSSPLGYLIWSYSFILFFYLVIFSYLNKKNLKSNLLLFSIKKYWPWLFIMGLIGVFGSWLLMKAYTEIMVNYAIAIKRAGLLVPILLGPLLFKEKHLIKRLPGVLLMLGGAIIIIVFG